MASENTEYKLDGSKNSDEKKDGLHRKPGDAPGWFYSLVRED